MVNILVLYRKKETYTHTIFKFRPSFKRSINIKFWFYQPRDRLLLIISIYSEERKTHPGTYYLVSKCLHHQICTFQTMTDYHLVCTPLCFDILRIVRMVKTRQIFILLSLSFSLSNSQQDRELFNSIGDSDLSDDEKWEQLRWFPADLETDCEKEPNSELVKFS